MSWTNPFVRKDGSKPVCNSKERTTQVYLDSNFQSLIYLNLVLPDASPVVAFGEISIVPVVNTHFTIEYYIQFTNPAIETPIIGSTRSLTMTNSNGHEHTMFLCDMLSVPSTFSPGTNVIRVFARCVDGVLHAYSSFTGLTAMGQLELTGTP